MNAQRGLEDTISAEEYRELLKKKKSKYSNEKETIDGIVFDSKREARRYEQLKLLQRGGVISGLELQKAFILQPEFVKNGRKIAPIKYIADFVYTDNDRTIVEDVKGCRTKEYQLKKKLFEFKYPLLTITEV